MDGEAGNGRARDQVRTEAGRGAEADNWSSVGRQACGSEWAGAPIESAVGPWACQGGRQR